MLHCTNALQRITACPATRNLSTQDEGAKKRGLPEVVQQISGSSGERHDLMSCDPSAEAGSSLRLLQITGIPLRSPAHAQAPREAW